MSILYSYFLTKISDFKKVDVSLDSIIDYFQIVCILTYTVHVENIFESVFEWY